MTEQAGDVVQWRKLERERLVATRLALAADYRDSRSHPNYCRIG